MKKNVRDTSIDAYNDLDDVNHKQFIVYTAIKTLNEQGKRCTDKDIADFLEWEINRVTPRRYELEAQKKIKTSGKVSGYKGRSSYNWIINDNSEKDASDNICQQTVKVFLDKFQYCFF